MKDNILETAGFLKKTPTIHFTIELDKVFTRLKVKKTVSLSDEELMTLKKLMGASITNVINDFLKEKEKKC